MLRVSRTAEYTIQFDGLEEVMQASRGEMVARRMNSTRNYSLDSQRIIVAMDA
jgi:hypothetical protein